jgi:hypothetical protein
MIENAGVMMVVRRVGSGERASVRARDSGGHCSLRKALIACRTPFAPATASMVGCKRRVLRATRIFARKTAVSSKDEMVLQVARQSRRSDKALLP